MLFDSFIFSNLNYFSLEWHLCSATLSQKIQECILKLLYNDSNSNCNTLLLKAERATMEVAVLGDQKWSFLILKSSFHTHIFQERLTLCQENNKFSVNRTKTKTFAEKSLKTLKSKIWNSLPEDAKDLDSLPKFSEFIKTWYKSGCKCNICKYLGNPYHYT